MRHTRMASRAWLAIVVAVTSVVTSLGTTLPASANARILAATSPSRSKIPANFTYVGKVVDDKVPLGGWRRVPHRPQGHLVHDRLFRRLLRP